MVIYNLCQKLSVEEYRKASLFSSENFFFPAECNAPTYSAAKG